VTSQAIEQLLEQGPKAVNIGVREFAEALAAQDAPVVHVEWTPPAELEQDLAELLAEIG